MYSMNMTTLLILANHYEDSCIVTEVKLLHFLHGIVVHRAT